MLCSNSILKTSGLAHQTSSPAVATVLSAAARPTRPYSQSLLSRPLTEVNLPLRFSTPTFGGSRSLREYPTLTGGWGPILKDPRGCTKMTPKIEKWYKNDPSRRGLDKNDPSGTKNRVPRAPARYDGPSVMSTC